MFSISFLFQLLKNLNKFQVQRTDLYTEGGIPLVALIDSPQDSSAQCLSSGLDRKKSVLV